MSERWRDRYDSWKTDAGTRYAEVDGGNYTCESCGSVVAWEGEFPDTCINCGDPVYDDRASAEDAAIEKAERQREDMMFDRDSWEDR